jgi:hypothetical protein
MRNRRESRAKSSILTLKKAPRRNAVRLCLILTEWAYAAHNAEQVCSALRCNVENEISRGVLVQADDILLEKPNYAASGYGSENNSKGKRR